MKNKIEDNVEYVDFSASGKQKPKAPEIDAKSHTNPLASKFFKFVHSKLSKFNPKDLF